MITTNGNDLIPYSSASNMVRAYVEGVEAIEKAQAMAEEAVAKLNAAFQPVESYRHFDIRIITRSGGNETEEVASAYKLLAWRLLIDRLGIKKTMSTKRREEFDKLFSGNSYQVSNQADKMPDLTVETIYDVLMGYCSSAEEFLQEAIHEEYDFWKCHSHRAHYATNRKSLYKLDRKVIKEFMVGEGWGRTQWRVDYDREKHVISLDNIFHLLDGRGCIEGCKGPLVDAIAACDGSGETEFFRFRCFKNRNLHLEFRRLDLLAKFNEICGRNRLPSDVDQFV